MQWQKDFVEKAKSTATPFSTILEQIRAEHSDLPGYIGPRDWDGHQQGEWMIVLISGPTEEAAESYFQTWATWARGDVYEVRIERKCPITNSWFTSEDDEPITNFYKESSRPLEESVRELVERKFDVNTRKVSIRGEAIMRQSELTSEIHEAKSAFANLGHAGGMFSHITATDVAASAENIFNLYNQLVEALEDQIEEL